MSAHASITVTAADETEGGNCWMRRDVYNADIFVLDGYPQLSSWLMELRAWFNSSSFCHLKQVRWTAPREHVFLSPDYKGSLGGGGDCSVLRNLQHKVEWGNCHPLSSGLDPDNWVVWVCSALSQGLMCEAAHKIYQLTWQLCLDTWGTGTLLKSKQREVYMQSQARLQVLSVRASRAGLNMLQNSFEQMLCVHPRHSLSASHSSPKSLR